MRQVMKFDYDWKFNLGDIENGWSESIYDSDWRLLNLPHDWAIELQATEQCVGSTANGFFPGGIGWYRKSFDVPAESSSKSVSICFDGVYHNSDVYINGHHLGNRPYGYVSFSYDLTPYLNYGGVNNIAVRVDHSDVPTSRWYSGSGIYRHVWLTTTEKLHVALWGTYATTPGISAESASVRVQTSVVNEHDMSKHCILSTSILDASGEAISSSEKVLDIPSGETFKFDQTLEVANPKLWSVELPTMYSVKTEVRDNGKVVDIYTTPFGIREVCFDSHKGFLLNGVSMKMKGICMHHDGGCLGAAVPERTWERRFEVLKEMGCNAIRTSHNPVAPELLDLCDRMGFLVIDEAFDKWKSGYYEKYFDQWWKTDLDSMLRRDRNHPSVVLWSVGNEVVEQGSPEGTAILKMLIDYVHETEPSRLATYASHPGRDESNCVNSNGFSELEDVVSYNYQEQWYEKDREQYPDRIMVGTETYPYYRGRTDYKASTKLFNPYCDYAATNPWYDVVEHDYVVGQFIWTGIDYLGESAGWPSKGWPDAPIDTCGFLKARAGFLRCVWNEKPAVHIGVLSDTLDIDRGQIGWGWPKMAHHWNFPECFGRLIRVETMTNCESVELLLNGDSLGTRDTAGNPNNTIPWTVPYVSGSLKAIGKNNGQVVSVDEIITATEPASISVTPDRTIIKADAQDISNLVIDLLDANGVLVPDSDRLVTIEIVGPGTVAGMDNGDLRCLEPYKTNQHSTQWGKCLVVVQSTRESGKIQVTVKVEELPDVLVEIESV